MVRPPARTSSTRMSIRHTFDPDSPYPILGDLVREKRGKSTRRAVGQEAGVGAHVVLDIENYYSAKLEEIRALCQWVGKDMSYVQTPPPIISRSFGRPRKDGSSDQVILESILEWISSGNQLSKYESVRLQVDSKRAKRMVTRYMKSSGEFRAAYQQARTIGAHFLAEQVIDIADDPTLDAGQAKNMIEARKWAAARYNPGVFGNNTKSDVNVNVGFGDALEQLEKRRERNALPRPNVIDIEVLPLQRADDMELATVETSD